MVGCRESADSAPAADRVLSMTGCAWVHLCGPGHALSSPSLRPLEAREGEEPATRERVGGCLWI